MAAKVAGAGGSVASRAMGFLRKQSLVFIRRLSDTPSNSEVAAEVAKKPKRKKKKNLFEVAQFLPDWGIGFQMAKNHWRGTSYQITKINLYKDGRHGKAWGIFHKEGIPSPEGPKKISGVHKRGWRYIPEPKKKQPLESAAVEQTS